MYSQRERKGTEELSFFDEFYFAFSKGPVNNLFCDLEVLFLLKQKSKKKFLLLLVSRSHQQAVWERQSFVRLRFCLLFPFLKSFTTVEPRSRRGCFEFLREFFFFFFLDKVKYGYLLLFKEKKNITMALNCLKLFQITCGERYCAYSAALSDKNTWRNLLEIGRQNFLVYL